MFKRITLTALLALTPALSYSVDLNQAVATVQDELNNTVIPLIEKIKTKKIDQVKVAVESYFADSSKQLIPQELFAYSAEVGAKINDLKQQLLKLVNKIPNEGFSALNYLSSGAGDQLQAFKNKAAQALAGVDLQALFVSLANKLKQLNITRSQAEGKADEIAAKLVAAYQASNININELLSKANDIVKQLGTLKEAAQNLESSGIIATLSQVPGDVTTFVNAPNDDTKSDLLDNSIIPLGLALNSQAKTIAPFVSAVSAFLRSLVPFVEKSFNVLGPVIWAEIPTQEQNAAKNALNTVKAQLPQVLNVVDTIKDKLSAFVQ